MPLSDRFDGVPGRGRDQAAWSGPIGGGAPAEPELGLEGLRRKYQTAAAATARRAMMTIAGIMGNQAQTRFGWAGGGSMIMVPFGMGEAARIAASCASASGP